MKILITGKSGYIGKQLGKHLRESKRHEVSFISLRNDDWKKKDLRGYDAIVHLAGLVHQKAGKPLSEYLRINRDMTAELAEKAKGEGIGHFVFFSTMAVYGETGSVEETTVITPETRENPKTPYALSKFLAEKELFQLDDESFTVTVLRPPLVYGRDCPGNFQSLMRIADKAVLFPTLKNQRSMIYIENLLYSVAGILDKRKEGIFFPQDESYRSTYEILRDLRRKQGKRTLRASLLNPVVKALAKRNLTAGKAFGSLIYQQEMSEIPEVEYQKVSWDKALEAMTATSPKERNHP